MEFGSNTVFVTGVAKVAKDDPIASSYEVFFVGLVVDKNTCVIVDATCNTARDLTMDFIRSIVIGHNLETELNAMTTELRNRFFGLVRKPLLVALKDAHNRFMVVKRAETRNHA